MHFSHIHPCDLKADLCQDVKDYTVVAGNPAKVIRRIEPGPNVNLHHPDIQEQNDRMLREMVEEADRRRHDR